VAQLSPGVLYAIAAHQIARRNTAGARMGRLAAGVQIAVAVGSMLALIAGAGRIPGAQFLLIRRSFRSSSSPR